MGADGTVRDGTVEPPTFRTEARLSQTVGQPQAPCHPVQSILRSSTWREEVMAEKMEGTWPDPQQIHCSSGEGQGCSTFHTHSPQALAELSPCAQTGGGDIQEQGRSMSRGVRPHPQKAHFNWFLEVQTLEQQGVGIWTGNQKRHGGLIPKT